MNWMDKLERKWGRYAVPNLSRYFVGAVLLGLLMELVTPNALNWINFSVDGILHGQIWRLVSWIFMPSTSLDFWDCCSFCVCSRGAARWNRSLERSV